MHVATFTFNDFQENTFVLYDDTKNCCIVDPGCNNESERTLLIGFIESNNITPIKLVNTHCHIDHVLGNKFISEKYNLPLISHRGEQIVLDNMDAVSRTYGIPYEMSPDITEFLEEGDVLEFGNTKLEVLFTPGHSPASISFFHRESKQLLAGDVLFKGSIGRTDLPGGSMETLIDSIKTRFMTLDDDVIVYPGHMGSTTIGAERKSNPFLTGV